MHTQHSIPLPESYGPVAVSKLRSTVTWQQIACASSHPRACIFKWQNACWWRHQAISSSAKPRVMTPQSGVNFPKIDLKSPLKVQKQHKKWVMRAVFALFAGWYQYYGSIVWQQIASDLNLRAVRVAARWTYMTVCCIYIYTCVCVCIYIYVNYIYALIFINVLLYYVVYYIYILTFIYTTVLIFCILFPNSPRFIN